MATLHEQVIAILRAGFSELQDGLETVPETGRVVGAVISPDFRKTDHEQRQNKLWAVLEKHFTKDQLKSVGPIVTLTPLEAQIDVSVDE